MLSANVQFSSSNDVLNISQRWLLCLQAYQERQKLGAAKQIETHKLEGRIKDYVRELIKRLHERKSGRL